MQTVIYQSYHTHPAPPAWLAACMATVRDWAARNAYDYAFYDDTFFDRVPDALRARIGDQKCPLSDYARLAVARELLSTGHHDRAIWLDADALIFAPDHFHIPIQTGYAFTREIWLHRTILGRPQFKLTVNNSVSVFCRDEHILDYYLDAAQRITLSGRPITTFSLGTDFLIALRRTHPFPLLTNIGIFGPDMTAHYLHDDPRYLHPYLAHQTTPIAAANLCLSKHPNDTRTPDALVARLLSDNGSSLNRHYHPPQAPTAPDEFTRPLSPYLALKETIHAARHMLRIMRNADCRATRGLVDGMRNENSLQHTQAQTGILQTAATPPSRPRSIASAQSQF